AVGGMLAALVGAVAVLSVVKLTTSPGAHEAEPPHAAAGSATATLVSEPTGAARPDDFPIKAAACARFEATRDWQGLRDCAGKLAGLGARDQATQDKAEAFRVKAVKETAAEADSARMQDALRDGKLREAQKQLQAIDAGSVYWNSANDAFKAAEAPAVHQNPRKAPALV